MQNQLHLNLPHFFAHHIEELNSAANSKLISFSSKWSRSYIVLVLEFLAKFEEKRMFTELLL